MLTAIILAVNTTYLANDASNLLQKRTKKCMLKISIQSLAEEILMFVFIEME